MIPCVTTALIGSTIRVRTNEDIIKFSLSRTLRQCKQRQLALASKYMAPVRFGPQNRTVPWHPARAADLRGFLTTSFLTISYIVIFQPWLLLWKFFQLWLVRMAVFEQRDV